MGVANRWSTPQYRCPRQLTVHQYRRKHQHLFHVASVRESPVAVQSICHMKRTANQQIPAVLFNNRSTTIFNLIDIHQVWRSKWGAHCERSQSASITEIVSISFLYEPLYFTLATRFDYAVQWKALPGYIVALGAARDTKGTLITGRRGSLMFEQYAACGKVSVVMVPLL